MNKVILSVAAAALFAGAGALPAQGAAQVLGNGMSRLCFDQAESMTNVRAGINLCTDSLRTELLSQADRASTLINRGILRAMVHDTAGALRDYEEALQIGANDGEAYINRAATLIDLKRYDEAVADANKAIELKPRRLEVAYYNRGLANEQLGNIGGAFQDYRQALAIEPKFAAAERELQRFRVVTPGRGS